MLLRGYSLSHREMNSIEEQQQQMIDQARTEGVRRV